MHSDAYEKSPWTPPKNKISAMVKREELNQGLRSLNEKDKEGALHFKQRIQTLSESGSLITQDRLGHDLVLHMIEAQQSGSFKGFDDEWAMLVRLDKAAQQKGSLGSSLFFPESVNLLKKEWIDILARVNQVDFLKRIAEQGAFKPGGLFVEEGFALLQTAVREENLEKVSLLIEHGVSVLGHKTKTLTQPLLREPLIKSAMRNANVKVAHVLIKQGALSLSEEEKKTVLSEAIRWHHRMIIDSLLTKTPELLKEVSLIYEAAQKGHLDLMQHFFECGSPLAPKMRHILSMDMRFNNKEDLGFTNALAAALTHGHLDAAQWCIDQGQTIPTDISRPALRTMWVQIINSPEEQALALTAIVLAQPHMLKRLRLEIQNQKESACEDYQDPYEGRFPSPMEIAVGCGHKSVILALMDAGLPTDRLGGSADHNILTLAADLGDSYIFGIVLGIVDEKKMDLKAKNGEGQSALDIIKRSENGELNHEMEGLLEARIARMALLDHIPATASSNTLGHHQTTTRLKL